MSKNKLARSGVSDIPINKNSTEYKYYKKTIPHFEGEAIYVYSLKEKKMHYANGWFHLLGYKDDEITLQTIINITTPKFTKFTQELTTKAFQFLKTSSEKLEKHNLTVETEKIHKDGRHIPLFSKIGVFKCENGKATEIVGVFQVIETLKQGEIMQISMYGPNVFLLKDSLNKELFNQVNISKKEKEALKLAAQGFTFKEIAAALNVSQSAIEKRIIPLYKRFDVSSLPHLINFAHINHIL